MGIFPTLRQLLKSKLWRRFSPFSQADAVPHLPAGFRRDSQVQSEVEPGLWAACKGPQPGISGSPNVSCYHLLSSPPKRPLKHSQQPSKGATLFTCTEDPAGKHLAPGSAPSRALRPGLLAPKGKALSARCPRSLPAASPRQPEKRRPFPVPLSGRGGADRKPGLASWPLRLTFRLGSWSTTLLGWRLSCLVLTVGMALSVQAQARHCPAATRPPRG